MHEDAKRAALRAFTYGLVVVGARAGDEVNGMTATWITQVSFEPPLVALAVERHAHTHQLIGEGRCFSINLLASGQKQLAAKFTQPQRRAGDKLGPFAFRLGLTGCPILLDALGYVDCELVQAVETGDHTLFIGRVVDAGMHRAGQPLTLAETGWHYGG
jgi:flavin reductase (DIM6/NTAB) family NADH-FMN oxidoreductase RutF